MGFCFLNTVYLNKMVHSLSLPYEFFFFRFVYRWTTLQTFCFTPNLCHVNALLKYMYTNKRIKTLQLKLDVTSSHHVIILNSLVDNIKQLDTKTVYTHISVFSLRHDNIILVSVVTHTLSNVT